MGKASVVCWRRFHRLIVAFILGIFLMPSGAAAQNSSNKGTDFWVGFMNHRNGTSAEMYLYITSDSSTTGTVSVPGQSWSTNFTVTANQMTLVKIPSGTAYVSCSDCIEDRGIHVESQKPIVVYSHIYHQYCSDATLVLPTPTTGKEYYAMSYEQLRTDARSQFMVIANKNNTKVRITPAVDLQGSSGTRTKGTAYEVTLDAGEVYQGRALYAGAAEDVTGTHIEVIDTGSQSDCRTVAVFSGSSDTYILCSSAGGGGLNSRDNLYQQLYPKRSWGTKFVTIPFKNRSIDHVRVMAAENSTQVITYHETGAPTVKTLNAGDFYDFRDVKSTLYILAGKPITVAQYQVSQKCGGKGDPSMTILSPIEQTLENITVYSSQYEDIDDHYINVIIPNAGKSSFKIDGNSVTTWKTVPKYAGYSYAQLTVSKGNHQLSADEGFLAIAYGFGDYESYGYSAGANVKDLTAKIDLTNSAKQDFNFVCLGNEAKFEGSAEYQVSKWVWKFGDGNEDTTQKVTHTYADTGVYTVKLYTYKGVYDGCSQYDSSELEVHVNAPPVAKLSSNALCENQLVRFDDSSYFPPGEKQIFTQWNFHNNTTRYSKFATQIYDTAGPYHIQLIVGSENQCKDTLTDTIYINAQARPSFTVDNVCNLDTSNFTNTSTLDSGNITQFFWRFGDGDSSLLESPSHFYQDSGTYYAVLTVTTDSGCITSVTDTLVKYEKFTIDFEYVDTCAGLTVDMINISSSAGTALKDFVWKIPTFGVDSSTQNLSYEFVNAGVYDVWLLGSLDTLCRDSVLHKVIVDPNVNADFNISGACMSDSIQFTSTSYITGGSIANLDWDFGDGSSGTGQSTKHKYSSSGSKTVQLIVATDQGCTDTTTQDVTLYNPQITGFSNLEICENENTIIRASMNMDGDTVQTYSWTSGASTSSADSFALSPSGSGKRPVQLTIVTQNGCQVDYEDTLTIWAEPRADFIVLPVCMKENLVPINISSPGQGQTLINYSWRFDGSQVSTQQNPSIPASSAGTKSIELIVSSNKGCSDTLSSQVVVYDAPQVNFSYADTCLNDFTSFGALSTVGSGSISSNQWDFSDGATYATNSFTHQFAAAQGYQVKLISTTDAGCYDSISKTVTIVPLPVLNFTVDDVDGCTPHLVNFTNNSTIASGAISTYQVDYGNGQSASVLPSSYVYTSPGAFNFTVIGISDRGCSDTFNSSTTINVLPTPVANFDMVPLEPSLIEPDLTLLNTSSPDATSFAWSISDGSTYNTKDVNHTFTSTGDFTIELIATADNGCADTATKPIHVKLNFFVHVPSAISPNNDLLNDVFKVDGMIDEVKGYSIQIFNRWGEVIFTSEQPTEGWDGTLNGNLVPAGFYSYLLRYRHFETGQWVITKGSVYVMR